MTILLDSCGPHSLSLYAKQNFGKFACVLQQKENHTRFERVTMTVFSFLGALLNYS